MPGAHAILSPSASKRWMECPPSARREALLPEESSPYAVEGSLAHRIAEVMLTAYRDLDLLPMTADDLLQVEEGTVAADLRQLQQECSEAALDYNAIAGTVHDGYVLLVYEEYQAFRRADKDTRLLVEARLNLRSFIPEGFGSSDAVIIGNDTVSVYDLKFGKGIKVDAVNNPQMMIYALGAVYGPADDYVVHDIRMTIVQPRLAWYSRFETTFEGLTHWGKYTLRPAAAKAFEGAGEYRPGAHCRFCRVAPSCRVCEAYSRALRETFQDPSDLRDDELGYVLAQLDVLRGWAAKVETRAMDLLQQGKPVEGWKLVEGRSVRKISDQDAAIERLKAAGIDLDTVLKAPELKGLTDPEKVLRKSGLQTILGDLITKSQGKPTLAREDDPRPAMTPDTSKDFE